MGEKQLDLPTVVSFIRYCLLNGAEPEQIHDALLVANLDRRLIQQAFKEVRFREESDSLVSELALDFEKAATDPALKIPEPPLQKLRRRLAERIELCPTPYWPGVIRGGTRPKDLARKPRPLSWRQWVLRSGFALWVLAGVALFSVKNRVIQPPPRPARDLASNSTPVTLGDPSSLRTRIASFKIRSP